MKFFKRLRSSKSQQHLKAAVYDGATSEPKSRSRLRLNFSSSRHGSTSSASGRAFGGSRPARNLINTLPKKVLENIFGFVAPHVFNDVYLPCEEVFEVGDCVLCDTRDLAHCALVCQQWSRVTIPLLYRVVRLEVVHYCPLEEELTEKRARRSFFQTDPEQVNVALERMKLIGRTMQERESMGALVQILRMQFMTREAQRQDLVKLISMLPNLRFVDLPAGFFRDEPSCMMLKNLMAQRCPELRRMKWEEGAETGFTTIANERPWPALEIINLSKLRVDDGNLLAAIRSLSNLRSVTLHGLPFITDRSFLPSSYQQYGSLFPALRELQISECDNITVEGLLGYVCRADVAPQLQKLDLVDLPKVPAWRLAEILNEAPALDSLRFGAMISAPFPQPNGLQNPPAMLQNSRLKHLAYEVRDEMTSPRPQVGVRGDDRAAVSYYMYLIQSICEGNFPSLESLYVFDPRFSQRLTDWLPNAKSLKVLSRLDALTIFSKGPDDVTWISQKVGEEDGGPADFQDDEFGALIALSTGAGNASPGGMLSVPRSSFSGLTRETSLEPPRRPMSSSSARKRESRFSRIDLWR